MYNSVRLGKLYSTPEMLVQLLYTSVIPGGFDKSSGKKNKDRELETMSTMEIENKRKKVLSYYTDVTNYYIKLIWYTTTGGNDYNMDIKSVRSKHQCCLYSLEFFRFVRKLRKTIEVLRSPYGMNNVFIYEYEGVKLKLSGLKDEFKLGTVTTHRFKQCYLRIYARVIQDYISPSGIHFDKIEGVNIVIYTDYDYNSVSESYVDMFSTYVSLDDLEDFVDSVERVDIPNLILNAIIAKRSYQELHNIKSPDDCKKDKEGVEDNQIIRPKRINLFDKKKENTVEMEESATTSNVAKKSALDSFKKFLDDKEGEG